MATPIGQNKDGSFIYEENMSVAPKAQKVKINPITPQSSGIPGVGVPQVPGINPIVPQSLIDKSQPMPEDKTPEAFKAMVLKTAPEGIANDGRRYADISAYEFTKMLVDKAPDGVTKGGIPYKDYLVKPRNREEAFIASGAMPQVTKDKARRDEYISATKNALEQTVSGGINLTGKALEFGERAINARTGKYGESSFDNLTYEPAKEAMEGSVIKDITDVTAGATSFVTRVLPVSAATIIAFDEMRDMPGLEYVPKALDVVAEGAVGGLKMTGMEEEVANNVVATVFNLGFIHGGIKGQTKIANAYKTRGLQGALETSALIVPQTVVDMALQPFNLGKGAYDFIRGKKAPPGPGSESGFTYKSDSGFKGESPGAKGEYNAQTSSGVPFTMETPPSAFSAAKDRVFQRGTNVDLATRSVFPKATKEKGPEAQTQAGETALAGVEQMYNDNRTGITTADISTMPGGSEAIEQGLDYYGKQIGEFTSGTDVMQVSDITSALTTALENPLSRLGEGMSKLAKTIVDVFSDPKYKDGMTINDAQDAMSTIKSQIFSDHKNVSALYKETSGKAVKDFLDTFSERFERAIEETTGNLPELQKAKAAYTKYKKIQKDFVASMLVNERNAKGGALSKAGSAVGLYELFRNPTLSGIATSIITKAILNEMGMAKSRGGAYESLIRNLDREALERQKTNPKASSPNPPGYDNRNFGNNNDGVASERPVPVKPEPAPETTPVNITPGESISLALKKGMIDIKKAIQEIKKLSPEEIAKYPELQKLVEIDDIVKYIDNVEAEYGALPPQEVTDLVKHIQEGNYTPEQKKYIMDSTPKEVKAEVQKQNRIRDYGKDFTEKPVKVTVKPDKKKQARQATSKGKLYFMDMYDAKSTNVGGEQLYKAAKYFSDNEMMDMTNFGDEPILQGPKLAQRKKYARELAEYQKHKQNVQEFARDVELAATEMDMDADTLFNDIKDNYEGIERGDIKGGSMEDNVAQMERDYEVELEKQRELQSLQEVADTMPEAPTTPETPPEVVSTPEPLPNGSVEITAPEQMPLKNVEEVKAKTPEVEPTPEIAPIEAPAPVKAKAETKAVNTETIPKDQQELLNSYTQKETGKDFEKVSGKQMRDAIAKAIGDKRIESVPYNESVFSKITDPKKGIDDVSKIRPSLFYGSMHEPTFTDAYTLVYDKALADSIKANIKEQYIKDQTKSLMKGNRNISFSEANDMVNKSFDKSVEQHKGQYPSIEQFKPKTQGTQFEIKSMTNEKSILANKDGENVHLNSDKLAFFKKQYPDMELYSEGGLKPVQVYSGGKLKAIIMPLKTIN